MLDETRLEREDAVILLAEAARDYLKGGYHEGPCQPFSDETGCPSCKEAEQDRREALKRALRRYDRTNSRD